MSEPLSVCEKCGVEFARSAEVTSSRVLCPRCAAERRARLQASKSVGAPATSSATKAPAATEVEAPAAPAARARKATKPAAGEHPHHEHMDRHDLQKAREAAEAKMIKLGWMVTGGIALVVGLILLFVMNKRSSIEQAKLDYEAKLDAFKKEVLAVDLNNEPALKSIKEKIDNERKFWKNTRIEADVSSQRQHVNNQLQIIIKTRSLVEKLDGIETQLNGSPTLDVLGKQFAASRDAELKVQAEDAGGNFKVRYEKVVRTAMQKYIDALRAAATAAKDAKTGEELAPFGQLEDTLRIAFDLAVQTNDTDAQQQYTPALKSVMKEINDISLKLFDDAYISKAPAKNLLTDTEGWTAIKSDSFSFKFGSGLTLTNGSGENAATGGVSYTPGRGWRDYVVEMEMRVDTGTCVFYTRVGDKMDLKAVPAFSIGGPGAKATKVSVEYGKPVSMVVKVIGNQLVVFVDGSPVHQEDGLAANLSRKGEPGISVPAGSSLTITKMQVKVLR